MPTYEVTGPNGKKYRVTGPGSAEEALAQVKQRQGGAPAGPVGVTEDVVRSGGSGLRTGTEALLGFPGEVNQATQRGMKYIAQKLFGEQAQQSMADVMPEGLKSEGITTQDVRGVTEPLIGKPYEPQTRPGRYSRAVTEQVPGMVVGPGNWLTKLLQAGLAGGGGEFAAEQAEGTGYEDMARMGGAAVGALVGGRAGRPGTTGREAAHDANVATLQREGVPMSAGQQTGSPRVKYIESELGGSAFDKLIDRQRSVFTDRAMQRLGQEGTALPEDLARANARIGGEFDRLASTTAVPFDQQLQTDLLNTAVDYQEVAPQVAPVVENLMNRMGQISARNGGVLDGPAYKEMTTKLRELGASADVPTGQALNAFRDALDSAIERNLTGPALDQWRNARRQYANLMTVERAMTGGGIEQASGMVSPVRLRGAISGGGNGPRAIAEGRSTMTDLANAGTGVLKDMPQSGTGPRLAARGIGAAAGGAAGALAAGDPMMGIPSALMGGIVGPEMMGSAVMSPPIQALLRGMPDDQRMVLSALLAARQAGAGR